VTPDKLTVTYILTYFHHWPKFTTCSIQLFTQ